MAESFVVEKIESYVRVRLDRVSRTNSHTVQSAVNGGEFSFALVATDYR
ncbi:MAG: hypothetical protein OXN97_02355 [Bryobacterales bacterium]|nr:hypothetical protein [Bryobacterales bacterium]